MDTAPGLADECRRAARVTQAEWTRSAAQLAAACTVLASGSLAGAARAAAHQPALLSCELRADRRCLVPRLRRPPPAASRVAAAACRRLVPCAACAQKRAQHPARQGRARLYAHAPAAAGRRGGCEPRVAWPDGHSVAPADLHRAAHVAHPRARVGLPAHQQPQRAGEGGPAGARARVPAQGRRLRGDGGGQHGGAAATRRGARQARRADPPKIQARDTPCREHPSQPTLPCACGSTSVSPPSLLQAVTSTLPCACAPRELTHCWTPSLLQATHRHQAWPGLIGTSSVVPAGGSFHHCGDENLDEVTMHMAYE
eukprot:scaffold5923_cov57-Phaeocystis_antarctica.AAC.2